MLARAFVGNMLFFFFAAGLLAQEGPQRFSWDQIPNRPTSQPASLANFSWENAKTPTVTNAPAGFDWNSLRVSSLETAANPNAAGQVDQLFNWTSIQSPMSNLSTNGSRSQESIQANYSDLPPPSSLLTSSNTGFPISKATMETRLEVPVRTGLELLQLVKQNDTPVEPIRVRPMNVLTNTDTSKTLKGSASTEKYIGPLGSGEDLFRNLNITNRYQTVGGIHLEETKIDSAATPYTWASPAFAHRPLYFEQPNLERYGIGHRKLLQPWASGVHFYGSVLLMPYKLLTQHPQESVYTLGNQRPGDCVCYQRRTLLGQSYFGEVCKYWEEYSGY